MKPAGKVKIRWSPQFAYAIGVIVTDGSLSSNGRSINITSKDLEMINNVQKCLETNFKIGKKSRSTEKEKKYFYIQIGDILLYKFLETIGLMSNKTKIIKEVKIPQKYFFDFLRGHFDGDGTSYSYWDKRWHSSFMFYTVFISASKYHIEWLRNEIFKNLKIKGHISKSNFNSAYQLKYAKTESLKLLPKMYYSKDVICLSRKRLKIEKALVINKLK